MQHAPTHRPTGFFTPYLVVRVIPAVYLLVHLPAHASMRTLVARAWTTMRKLGQRHRMCLVVSLRRGLYLEPDGSSIWRNDIPAGGFQIQTGRLNYKAFSGSRADK
jgi:hypothetical protein